MQQVSGGHSGDVTPVPIPNTEVKLASADGTWGVFPWESRSPPDFFCEGPRRTASGLRRVRTPDPPATLQAMTPPRQPDKRARGDAKAGHGGKTSRPRPGGGTAGASKGTGQGKASGSAARTGAKRAGAPTARTTRAGAARTDRAGTARADTAGRARADR